MPYLHSENIGFREIPLTSLTLPCAGWLSTVLLQAGGVRHAGAGGRQLEGGLLPQREVGRPRQGLRRGQNHQGGTSNMIIVLQTINVFIITETFLGENPSRPSS